MAKKLMQDQSKQDIILNNVKLEHNSSTKPLGLHIQTNLAWKEHITSAAKRLSSEVGLFLRLSNFLKFDTSILCKLYFKLAVPHLDYCITIRGNSPSSHTDMLQKLQNKLAMTISINCNYQIHGLDIVKHLGWTSVKERYQHFVVTFMSKHDHRALPPNLRHSFLRVYDKHHYSTRAANSSCLSLLKPCTELHKRSLIFRSI